MEIFIILLAVLVVGLIIIAARGNARRDAAQEGLPAVDDRGVRMKCLRCPAEMSSLGIERIRTGGTTGGWKLIFGEWAELGENMLDLEILACTSCRYVELRVPSYE